MRDQIAETLVGAAVLVVAGVFLAYSLSSGGKGSGGGYPLVANFGSAEGLSVGSEVRISGVKVGQVREIRLDPETYDAQVVVLVSNTYKLAKTSSISLKNEGLLGGVYLEIEPVPPDEDQAGKDVLKPNDEIGFGQGAIDVIRLLADFIASDRAKKDK